MGEDDRARTDKENKGVMGSETGAAEAVEAEDIAARFPDPEKDERLKSVRNLDLPEVPTVTFNRPKLPESRPVERFQQRTGGGAAEAGNAGLAWGAGLQLVTATLGGTGIGWLLDQFVFGKPEPPWGLIVGFFVGGAVGFMQLFQMVNRLNRDADK